jgi:hypothetical protein
MAVLSHRITCAYYQPHTKPKATSNVLRGSHYGIMTHVDHLVSQGPGLQEVTEAPVLKRHVFGRVQNVKGKSRESRMLGR